MAKKLIIAEKPSVASDIARALGGFTKKADYFESDDYVLSSAVGHLLELVVPEEFEVKRGKWSFKNLPVLPPRFALSPLEKSEQRLNVRETQSALYLFGDGVNLSQPIVVRMQGVEDSSWGAILQRIEQERALIRGRANRAAP